MFLKFIPMNLRISLFSLAFAAVANAQNLGDATIALAKPNLDHGASITKSFSRRKSASAEDFAKLKMPSMGELAELLWAANGVNRPDGHRTAPSAMNSQEVMVFVVSPKGAYLYDAAQNKLTQVAKEDLRSLTAAGQPQFASAPLFIVLASDLAKLRSGDAEGRKKMGAIDAGIVSQNIGLYCAGVGLSARVRASMDPKLATALGLTKDQELMLNIPVGK
jgi:nitroreductase